MAQINGLPVPVTFLLPGNGSSSRRKLFLGSLLTCVMFSCLILLASCGGGGSSTSSTGSRVSVSASTSNAIIVSGKTRQLTATVSNSPNTAVTWTTTAGTVSASGLFTAPSVNSAIQVNVTATSQADSSKSASVTLTVNPAGAVLAVSPASLSFSRQVGTTNLTPASLSITNAGAGTLTFTGVSDQSWLTLSAGSGTAPFTLEVSPSVSGLKVGTYTGHVTVTGASGTKAVPVALAVTAGPVQHSVSLSWKDNTAPNAASYSMYRSTISGGYYGLLAKAITGITYSDQSVLSGTVYYYVVTAVDSAGQESPHSTEVRVAIP